MHLTLTENTSWSTSRKFWFRFFCCLFILYTFPFPLNDIPFGNEINKISEKIVGWYLFLLDQVTEFWHWLIPILGKKLFQYKAPITIFTNGSGDTTFDYFLLLTQCLVSMVVSIVWSILDKKRSHYQVANYWLCVLVRYFLATNMLLYGFIKIFHLQMPFPNLSRLIEPYGDSSPMGLAWTYVGQSKAFSVFVGFAEVLCGLLLLFRKTTLMGALLSLVVMGNVVVINFCYDVPVKLFSSMLEIMALYLAAPYLLKLYRLFILQQPETLQKQVQPLFKKNWQLNAVRILKLLLIADALFYGVINNIRDAKIYGDNAVKPPLYGLYNVDSFVRNNQVILPLTTDSTRWKQLIIQNKDYSKVKMMNDSLYNYHFIIDTIKHTATVYSNQDTLHKSILTYQNSQSNLLFRGKINQDTVFIGMKRFNESRFRLISRGFHWINEFPYNK